MCLYSPQDETDGKFKFSIGKRKNKKSAKIVKDSPPTNHTSPLPVTPSPASPPPSSLSLSIPTTSSIPVPQPPPSSSSSSSSLTALPTNIHPLLEDAPINHDTITPNVREEATLEQSSSEDSLADLNQHSSPILLNEEKEGRDEKVKGGGRVKGVGECLSAEDEDTVRSFVSEFVGQRLVPHLESVMRNLNEWVSLNMDRLMQLASLISSVERGYLYIHSTYMYKLHMDQFKTTGQF